MGLTYEEALELAKKNNETVVPTMCAMCGPKASCGIYAFKDKDGKFVRVEGMNECPINKGMVCAKGKAAPEWVYAPERLKTPLLRIGEKGEGKFKEISWDEAMDILVNKLKEQKEKYGAKSLAILSPARRSYSEYIQRFLIAHGSPNYGHSGICAMQRAFSFYYTVGSSLFSCDYKNADMVIYWAKQPIYSGPATGSFRTLKELREKGAKIIGIKPTLEPDSKYYDDNIMLRPGTDAALALAMLNVVITNGLIDRDFVSKWCYGFDELSEHVKKYTPKWAENITGVDANQIIRVATEYATTKKASIDVGNGVEHSPSCSDACRAIAILIAITGHLDRQGCNLFLPPKSNAPKPYKLSIHERITKEMVDNLVGSEFPKEFEPFIEGTSSAYYKIIDSILTENPYPVRCIIAPGTQPSVSTRGTKRVIEALRKLEFYVVIDPTKTADMDYADLVFPSSTMYESDMPIEAFGNWLMARNKVIEPMGDYKSIYEFFIELGNRMGYGNDFWHGDIKAWEKEIISPYGMNIDELREYKTGYIYDFEDKLKDELINATNNTPLERYKMVFNSKSTRIDGGKYLEQGKVALYNTIFEKYGYSPMPVWREPTESLTGEVSKLNNPLLLSDYHTSRSYSASWLRNVESLRKNDMYPALHIHPRAAYDRGINDGDWVIVKSKTGWLRVKAEVTENTREDTVMLLNGWWQGCEKLGIPDMPLTDGGANVNNLYSTTHNNFDPLVTAMSSQALVEVFVASDDK